MQCLTTRFSEVFGQDTRAFRKAFGSTIGFLLRIHVANVQQAAITDAYALAGVAENGKKLRLEVIENFYVIGNLKSLCLSLMYRPAVDKLDLATRADKHSVSRKDALNASRAVEFYRYNEEYSAKFKDTVEHIKQNLKSAPDLLEVTYLQRVVREISDYVYAQALRLVKVKLNFVYKYNNMDPNDFARDAFCRGILAFYKKTPELHSKAHIISCVMQSVGREIVNMQTKNGSAKHRRLANVDDDKTGKKGHYLVVTCENQLKNGETSLDDLCDSVPEGSSDPYKQLSNELTLQTIFDQVGKCFGPAHQKVLTLLNGEFDPDFSAFLWQKKIKSPNDVYLEKVGVDNIIPHVASYVQLSSHEIHNFLSVMRSHYAH